MDAGGGAAAEADTQQQQPMAALWQRPETRPISWARQVKQGSRSIKSIYLYISLIYILIYTLNFINLFMFLFIVNSCIIIMYVHVCIYILLYACVCIYAYMYLYHPISTVYKLVIILVAKLNVIPNY